MGLPEDTTAEIPSVEGESPTGVDGGGRTVPFHSDIAPISPDRSRGSFAVPAPSGLPIPEFRHEMGNQLGTAMNATTQIRHTFETPGPDPEAAAERIVELLKITDEAHLKMWHLLRRVAGYIEGNSGAFVPVEPEESPEYELIDLTTIVDAHVKKWLHMMPDHIRIEVGAAPHFGVLGDSVELDEIITNLFKNAIQAAQSVAGQDPSLKVSIHEFNGKVQLMIEDNGPGISLKTQQMLFVPGFTTRKHGKGIGLAYSQALSKKMGGDLWLVNNFEREDLPEADKVRGATAVLELPIAPVAGDRNGNVSSL